MLPGAPPVSTGKQKVARLLLQGPPFLGGKYIEKGPLRGPPRRWGGEQ